MIQSSNQASSEQMNLEQSFIFYGSNKKLIFYKAHPNDYFFTIAGNKSVLYKYVSDVMGKLIPKEKSPAITVSFLENCLKEKVFTISRDDWQFPKFVKKVSKQELYIQFLESLKKKQIQASQIGFDELTLPNKEWLIGALYTINPLHEYFKAEGTLSIHDMISKMTKE